MKLGILIPATSRGRTWSSIEESYLYMYTIQTFLATCKTDNSNSEYTFYIGVDRNDPIYDNDRNMNAFEKMLMGRARIKFIYMDDIQRGHLTVMWNKLFQIAYDDGCDYFFQCGDDIIFKTDNWIEDCIKVQIENDGVCLTGPINNNCRILTQSFVSRKHMALFGYYFPPEIINWFCDDWINGVYRALGKFFPLVDHLCVNVGGEPRYDVNNKKYASREEFVREVNSVMRKQCDEIIARDIKNKNDYENWKNRKVCS